MDQEQLSDIWGRFSHASTLARTRQHSLGLTLAASMAELDGPQPAQQQEHRTEAESCAGLPLEAVNPVCPRDLGSMLNLLLEQLHAMRSVPVNVLLSQKAHQTAAYPFRCALVDDMFCGLGCQLSPWRAGRGAEPCSVPLSTSNSQPPCAIPPPCCSQHSTQRCPQPLTLRLNQRGRGGICGCCGGHGAAPGQCSTA